MDRQAVKSSRIKSVGWKSDIMEVEFMNGKLYCYFDVTINEFNSFMNAPSLGRAINTLEKHHKYVEMLNPY